MAAAVIVGGTEHEKWGSAVTAYIVPQGVDPAAAVAAMEKWVRGDSGLPSLKRPKRVMTISSVPVSAVGEILRRELNEGSYEMLADSAATPRPTPPASRTSPCSQARVAFSMTWIRCRARWSRRSVRSLTLTPASSGPSSYAPAGTRGGCRDRPRRGARSAPTVPAVSADTDHGEADDNVATDRMFEFGDVDAAFAAATHTITGRYSFPRFSSTPMECYVVIADWLETSDGPEVTAWATSAARSRWVSPAHSASRRRGSGLRADLQDTP